MWATIIFALEGLLFGIIVFTCNRISRQATKAIALRLLGDMKQYLLPSTNFNSFPQQQLMQNAYKLCNKFDEKTCGFCWNQFNDDLASESLLICGHRYHTRCLANWEKFKRNRCALCNVEYSNYTKWNYCKFAKRYQMDS